MDLVGLTHEQKELHRRTDEVLHYLWDPIGVSNTAYARDEYQSYLPNVFSLLINNKSENEIVDYLLFIESEHMGLTPDKDNAKRVVDILLEYKEKIEEEKPRLLS